MARSVVFLCSLALLSVSCSATGSSGVEGEARDFLETYNSLYVSLGTVSGEAWWKAKTDVTPQHDGERIGADKAFSAFAGSKRLIEKAREFLEDARSLSLLTARQLKRVLLQAAESPGTIPEVVAKRVEAEGNQSSLQDGFEFQLDGKKVTPNEIDQILLDSRDLSRRLKAWKASKEIGKPLREGLTRLQKLRNAVAREMGYSSFYALQVADYDMTVEEMQELLRGFIRDTRPLYLHLHTWVKHELAKRYGAPVPEGAIPAHWLPNRWGQNWPGIVEAANLDPYFAEKKPSWIVQQAENFYVSMGFDRLPPSFWEKSDLYPVPPGETRKKNSHASAWHIDLGRDVRSLMSVQADKKWFSTTHHELGHIYYFLAYARPEVPPILRAGANRGFHEGIGELISIASAQVPYLKQVGILPKDKEIDKIQFLLNEALAETIPFIAWSSGVMSHWERDLYEGNLPPSEYNGRWWKYKREFQGIKPPEPRGEEFCDPASKTHINDDPAQYYDYAIATVLKYQLHDHIARKILKQDPTSCSYYGRKDVGAFLESIMREGAARPWRELLREATGENLSTRAMMAYFQPLLEWLKKENEGRKIGWE